MSKILLAGATGYLGKYILSELERRNLKIRAISRDKNKLANYNPGLTEVVEAEVTKPSTLKNICNGIDVVISTVGITKQKDGLSYLDVDYRANKNLLDEAIKSRVNKFIYVSVLNGEKLRELKICDAKERFVDELKSSRIDYCIIRPNGFFSDMTEFFEMAKKGKVYLFGDGKKKANPIHGEDLAKVCVDTIGNDNESVEIGGPQTFTQNEIAKVAFSALNHRTKITHIPDWVRKTLLTLIRFFTSEKTYGPIEFFMTIMATDMIAPEYGKRTLEEYYKSLAEENN